MGNRFVRTLSTLAFLVTSVALAGDFGALQEFTTDGCTNFPDGTVTEPEAWKMCCIEHDLIYWAGGTRDERRQADRELKACVEASGHPYIAGLMYRGVRTAGSPRFNTSYRWGYGWPVNRGYTPLTNDELREVQTLSPTDLSSFL